MATTETMKKALEQTPPPRDLRSLIENSAKELGRALPEHMRPERLVRIALTCIRTTPKLANCTPESFLGSLFMAAQLGLEPIAGRAYLIPFLNSRQRPDGSGWHKVLEAQFVMGYRGLAELFYRHEKAVMLNWGVVKEKDDFDYELGTEAFLKHVPARADRGQIYGFYVIADLGKAKPFHYMSYQDCLEHGKKHSKTYDKRAGTFMADSPWATNVEAMCLKTVLIQLCKVLPLSFELARAVEQDETSRDYKAGIGDALEMPTTTDWQEPAQEPEKPAPAAISEVTGREIEFGDRPA